MDASFHDIFLQLGISEFTRVNDDNDHDVRAIFENSPDDGMIFKLNISY